uniref:Putative secreted protein n=1 Tax=Ixodes ricinus TaxID=34613 RepID=A0A6B0U0Z7_IXORI
MRTRFRFSSAASFLASPSSLLASSGDGCPPHFSRFRLYKMSATVFFCWKTMDMLGNVALPSSLTVT